MNRTKLVLIAVAAVLALILIVQNTEDVQTRVLFWTVALPRAVLLLVTLLLGFAIGVLAGQRVRRPPT